MEALLARLALLTQAGVGRPPGGPRDHEYSLWSVGFGLHRAG